MLGVDKKNLEGFHLSPDGFLIDIYGRTKGDITRERKIPRIISWMSDMLATFFGCARWYI